MAKYNSTSFIVKQVQEKFKANRRLCYTFNDLERAYDTSAKGIGQMVSKEGVTIETVTETAVTTGDDPTDWLKYWYRLLQHGTVFTPLEHIMKVINREIRGGLSRRGRITDGGR